MLNILFVVFIGVSLLYFLLSPRKELAALVLVQALLQYAWTLSLWAFHLTREMGLLLLVYMLVTTCLLIWARKLRDSPQQYSLRLFATVTQWGILLMLALLVSLRSPYVYDIQSNLPGVSGHQVQTLHPTLKLSGNLLLFTIFFHLSLHWGRKWSLAKSLLDLGPVLLYFCVLILLRFLQASTSLTRLAVW